MSMTLPVATVSANSGSELFEPSACHIDKYDLGFGTTLIGLSTVTPVGKEATMLSSRCRACSALEVVHTIVALVPAAGQIVIRLILAEEAQDEWTEFAVVQ